MPVVIILRDGTRPTELHLARGPYCDRSFHGLACGRDAPVWHASRDCGSQAKRVDLPNRRHQAAERLAVIAVAVRSPEAPEPDDKTPNGSSTTSPASARDRHGINELIDHLERPSACALLSRVVQIESISASMGRFDDTSF
jgi:hypothetical protein